MDYACLDLINSQTRDHRGVAPTTDHLADPNWLADFQRRWRLETAGPVDDDARRKLVDLRAALTHAVSQFCAGAELTAADLEPINQALAAGTGYRQITTGDETWRIAFVASRPDWSWAVAEVAASFADLLTQPEADRLRVCENDACRWVFIDTTRSRTQRWCGDTCGNLVKVRRFRARHRRVDSAATDPTER